MNDLVEKSIEHRANDTRAGKCAPTHFNLRPGTLDDELMWALLEFIDPFVDGMKSGRRGEVARSDPRAEHERLRIAERIDALHAMGAWWPRFGKRSADDPETFAFVPNVAHITPQRREPSERVDRGYCVEWTGMFWAPCGTPKRRRAAGYLPLRMCWPPPLPKAGEYLSSGARARFIYRVAEVERFKPPRGKARITCRLWCERVLPEDVPAHAAHYTFRWHPRKRRAA